MSCPPWASIEHTDHILELWPSKPSSLLSTEGWLYPHCFIGYVRREIGWRLVNKSTDVLWMLSRALFLKSSDFSNAADNFVKGCYMWTTWDTYGRGPYVDWAWDACDMSLIRFLQLGVHRFESLRLSDMNNHLSCGSQHVHNLMN
jgi:hypothetical protein